MEVRNNKAEIDVANLMYILLHKLWIILLIGLLGAVTAYAISNYVLQPVYTSTTKVYVINKQDDSKMTLTDLQTGSQLTKDYMILVKSRPVTEQVIKNLNLNITSEELSDLIQVNTPEDTRILEIIVKYHDPVMAKKLADAIAEISTERMVSVMDMEKVNVVEEGNLPQTPSGPNIMRNSIFGGFLGAILVSLIIILIHMLNDTIQTSDDIEKYLGITTLGILPIEEGSFKEKHHKKEHRIKQSRRKRKAALAS